MSHLRMEESPSLRSPVLVTAFAGWNDAAQAATASVLFLAERWSARRFASIDPEEFYDFTETRPIIRLDPELQRDIEWPNNTFYYHIDHSLSRDVVLLLGIEPQLKWRTFCESVLELARQHGVSAVVTLGALLADAVHTRPVPLAGYSTEPPLAEGLASMGLGGTPRYQGPTGIVGTLHQACRGSGLAVASLWASVPYYLGTTANPKASHALLSTLSGLMDLRLDLESLEEQARSFEEQVTQAVATNPEVAAHIRQLEQRIDTAQTEGGEPETEELPASDIVIKDLEDFLRRQRGNGEPP